MPNKCKTCGNNCDGDFCFHHKPYGGFKTKTAKPLKKGVTFKTGKAGKKSLEKALEMQYFFLKIWNKRPHKSEVSGDYLGAEPLSAYFHHILPKSKYPDLEYKEDNIILLTLDEHANVESDMYKYDIVNQKCKELTIKYL